jgi:hypothetical protein
MFPSNPHPKWWQVYLSLPLLALLFFAETRLKLSVRGHQVVQIGILLLVYGLIYLWLKANAVALSNLHPGYSSKTFRVYRIPSRQLAEPGSENRSMLQPPSSEIHGGASVPFSVHYIDADSFDIDKVSQVLNKE